MQIISGIYKGRKIDSPNDQKTHPMGSREKLALFNMISSYLPSSIVLDAFAGSGAIGLESISRGAQKVIFIEKSAKIANTIKNNISSLGNEVKEKTKVIIKDVGSFESTEKFDIIFADPPYNNVDIVQIKHLTNFLNSDGIFVLSHPDIPPELPNLKLIKHHAYAAANISIYKK